MKPRIYPILLMIGVFLSFSCSDDRSTDDPAAPTSASHKPVLIIGELDSPNRSLRVTISNPTGTAMFIPGSGDQSVYGAYWFIGEEILEYPECGTGFWDNSITIEPGEEERLSVRLPHTEKELPSKMTLAIVYRGHGEVTREELPSISDNAPRINLLRHTDALMGCRKVEAKVTIAGKPEQNKAAQINALPNVNRNLIDRSDPKSEFDPRPRPGVRCLGRSAKILTKFLQMSFHECVMVEKYEIKTNEAFGDENSAGTLSDIFDFRHLLRRQ